LSSRFSFFIDDLAAQHNATATDRDLLAGHHQEDSTSDVAFWHHEQVSSVFESFCLTTGFDTTVSLVLVDTTAISSSLASKGSKVRTAALGHYQTLRIHRNPSIERLLSRAKRSFRDRFVVPAKTVYLPWYLTSRRLRCTQFRFVRQVRVRLCRAHFLPACSKRT